MVKKGEISHYLGECLYSEVVLDFLASKKVGHGDDGHLLLVGPPKYMTGHRSATVSSCRGHGLPAHHHFRRPCPIT